MGSDNTNVSSEPIISLLPLGVHFMDKPSVLIFLCFKEILLLLSITSVTKVGTYYQWNFYTYSDLLCKDGRNFVTTPPKNNSWRSSFCLNTFGGTCVIINILLRNSMYWWRVGGGRGSSSYRSRLLVYTERSVVYGIVYNDLFW